jgi:hypothetical protein
MVVSFLQFLAPSAHLLKKLTSHSDWLIWGKSEVYMTKEGEKKDEV